MAEDAKEGDPKDAEAAEEAIGPGKKVECVGTSSATMNGSVGTVVSWNEEKQPERYL